MAVAINKPFVRYQLLSSEWASKMQFLCADGYFGTYAKLAAIRKSG
jgi:hypothetical protein